MEDITAATKIIEPKVIDVAAEMEWQKVRKIMDLKDSNRD